MDDLQILVKAIVDNSSAGSMDSELTSIVEKLESKHKIELDIGLKGSSVQVVQTQLQAIARQVSSANKGGSTLQVFDTAQLQADGRKYFASTKTLVADVQKAFTSLGKVDVTNVFKNAKGDIQSFTASVTKADGTIEKFNFDLAQIKDGAKTLKGFVQISSSLTDKNMGSGLNRTLDYLNKIEDRIKTIKSKTLTDTSKPLTADMQEYSKFNAELSKVIKRIAEIRSQNSAMTSEQKREIETLVSGLQRYGRELQKTAYAANDLAAKTFANQKRELQAALETDIKKWNLSGVFTGDFKKSVEDAKKTLDGAFDQAGLDSYKHKLSLIGQEFKRIKLEQSESGKILGADTLNANIQTAQLRIQNLRQTYSAFVNDPNLNAKWQALFDESQMVSSQKELTNLNAKIRLFEQELISAGKHTQSFWDTFKANAVKMGVWMILGGVISGVMRGVTGLYDSVVQLDTAMVELKKVTNETDEAYENFLSSAADKAVEIGTTYADFVTSTADFARLGYTMEEAQGLAEVANIYAVVGDDIDSVDTATSSIISTMKSFNIEAKDAMTIVDKFNEVGNNFAISSGGIGDAMSRSASALASANNTIDESIALIVAANNVIQDPDVVGNMWKTVSMRIRGAKTELEEAGLETEYMAESTASLRKEVKALTNVDGFGGFDIMLDDKTFKSTYDIILGISKVWKDMSDIDQAALLELLAGKRQGNALASAINNMDDAVKVLKTSVKAEGSAIEEHAKWMDSIQAKQQQFQAKYQDLANSILDSGLVKFAYDAGTGLLGWLTELVDTLGALPTLAAAITPFFDKMQLLQKSTNKNWLGSGQGFSFAWNIGKENFEKDIALLDDYNDRIIGLGNSTSDLQAKQIIWNDTIGQGSQNLKTMVKVSDKAAVSSSAYRTAMMGTAGSIKGVGVASKIAAVGVNMLRTALNMLINIAIGLVISGIIALFTKIANSAEEAKQKAEDYATSLKEEAQAAKETSESIRELIAQYLALSNAKDGVWSVDEQKELVVIQDQIADLIGIQADNLDLVNGKLDEEYEKLLNIYGIVAQDEYDTAESAYVKSKEKLENGYSINKDDLSLSSDAGNVLHHAYVDEIAGRDAVDYSNYMNSFGKHVDGIIDADGWDLEGWLAGISSYEEGLKALKEWRQIIIDSKNAGRLGYEDMGTIWTGSEWVEVDASDALSYLDAKIKEFEGVIQEAETAEKNFLAAKANKEVLNYLKTNHISSQDDFDAFADSVYNSDTYDKEYARLLIETMQSFYTDFEIPQDIAKDFNDAIAKKRQDILDKITSTDIWQAHNGDNGSFHEQSLMQKMGTFSDEELDVVYEAVMTKGITTWNEMLAAIEAYNAEQEYLKTNTGQLQTALGDLWNSKDFAETKEEIQAMAKSVTGITSENVEELAEESESLAAILEMDGMNAQFLANILQTMATGGDGLALITEEALALNNALDGMIDSFDKVTDAKARYDAAMSVDEKDTNFKSYAEAFEALNEEFKAGTTNSNAFWAAAEYLFGSEQLSAWGWSDGLDEIYKAMEANRSVFKDADSAGAGFIERLYQMAKAGKLVNEQGEKLLEIEKTSDGGYVFDVDPENIAAIAKAMGITEEATLACFQALSMFGDVDFYDISEVVTTLEEIGFAAETTGGKAVNVGLLTEQMLALGKTNKEIYDVLTALEGCNGVTLLGATDNVATLTTKLQELNLAASDGVTITVDYESLGTLLSQIGFTKEEASNLITTLGNADGISLANASGEVQGVSDALAYIDTLTFANVTTSVGTISDAVNDVNESSTDTVCGELAAVGGAAETATSKVYDLQTALDGLHSKTITVTYNVERKGGILGMFGFAKGTNDAPAGEALVGEEGVELWQSGNKARLVGVNGPEIVNLNKGDRIYPNPMTKKMLSKSGKRLSGTIPAYAGGTIKGAVTGSINTDTNKTGSTGTKRKSSSSSGKAVNEFEELYKKHQHLLAMDQESVEDYLDWLNSAYKKAYKNGQIDLDDYYKY